jgi:hypothetical protein
MATWSTVLTALMLIPSLGAGQEAAPQRAHASFWQAAAGVLAANGVTWGYNWYVQRWHWANVGTQSWAANLRNGFIWDDDCFVDNQLAHPYHGSVYLGSARASGYGFWGSLPYVAAGSATWELFFENVRPSLNDFVNTTLGGMALGEVTFRLSSLVSSRPSRGGAALGRQVGAFALSPMARVQSLLVPGPGGAVREDPSYQARLIAGTLRNHADAVSNTGTERGFVELAVEYGSPFDTGATKPYDAFQFRLQVSRGPTEVINRLEISGLLARHDIRRSERSQLTLGLFQHYDYHDSAPFEFGGQSLSGALLYRHALGSRAQVHLGAHVETVVLGAISSDHGNYFRRDYDYGPGVGARFFGSLRHDGRDLVRFEHRTVWLYSLHGAEASHLVTSAQVGTALPLGPVVQVGADVSWLIRHSSYRTFSSTMRRASQLRAFLVWSPF